MRPILLVDQDGQFTRCERVEAQTRQAGDQSEEGNPERVGTILMRAESAGPDESGEEDKARTGTTGDDGGEGAGGEE